ncbi:MAG: MBL fold metallo-hydrolase [Promethearchaeota archaeon]
MKITFLGTSGSIITADRVNISLLIDDDLLLDAGEGVTQRLLQMNYDLNKIERICITHFHQDHVSGLPGLIWTMWQNERKLPLEIIGPEGIQDLTISLLELMKTPLQALTFDLKFTEFIGGSMITEDISAIESDHQIRSMAYRIRRKACVCYSGDTRPNERIENLSGGCDVLIHEASFPNEMEELAHKYGHSTPGDAGKLAKKAGVKEALVLIHWPEKYFKEKASLIAQARAFFDGKIIVASDLDVIHL